MSSLICENCGKEYKRNKSFYLKHIEICGVSKGLKDKKVKNIKDIDLEESSISTSSSLLQKDNKTYKKELGQFYTTNYDYILQNLNIPEKEKNIIEPFAGAGHLLEFIKSSQESCQEYTIEAYDLEPGIDSITKRDTLNNPPSYKGKFILTNPPYLARNKTDSKELFDKYDTNDLYKCFIKQIILDPSRTECSRPSGAWASNGGILIIPLNFWCSIRKSDVELRRDFLNVYDVITINIFEERVFDDTSYTTCSFLFTLKSIKSNPMNVFIYPSKKQFSIELNAKNNYTFGGEIYNLPQSKTITVERLTKDNISDNSEFITNILVKCIDDNIKNKICLSIVDDKERYCDDTPKLSARSYATLVIKPKLSLEQQTKLVKLFNTYLDTQRETYNSLFLTNYRESNSIARKRISFSLVFEIVNYLLGTKFNL